MGLTRFLTPIASHQQPSLVLADDRSCHGAQNPLRRRSTGDVIADTDADASRDRGALQCIRPHLHLHPPARNFPRNGSAAEERRTLRRPRFPAKLNSEPSLFSRSRFLKAHVILSSLLAMVIVEIRWVCFSSANRIQNAFTPKKIIMAVYFIRSVMSCFVINLSSGKKIVSILFRATLGTW